MYKLRWAKRAVDDLTQMWLQSDPATRKAITAANHTIEKRLQRDPKNEGESRSDGRKITFEAPLAVVFRIEADGQTVSVLQIRLMRKRDKR